jgi:hypothetical protein
LAFCLVRDAVPASDLPLVIVRDLDLERELGFGSEFDVGRELDVDCALDSDRGLARDLVLVGDLLRRLVKDPGLVGHCEYVPDLVEDLAGAVDAASALVGRWDEERLEARVAGRRVLVGLARLLPAAERGRFVAEAGGDIVCCEGRWEQDRLPGHEDDPDAPAGRPAPFIEVAQGA